MPSRRLFGLSCGDGCIRNHRDDRFLAARAPHSSDTARMDIQTPKLCHFKPISAAICARQRFAQASYQSRNTAAQELP
jgi:hypothetical protein